MVTKADIIDSLKKLGIENGDTVLFHSSLKSFGRVENGPDDVIDAFLDVVGKDGTVVVPTLSMKDFNNAYSSWHINKPSDTGIITEVFRNRKESYRSDQATHSVAAIGAKAKYLTETHGKSGLRYGIYGNTPFTTDSPWQKLYDENATVVMVGVNYDTFTLRHLCEYTLVDRALKLAEKHGKYEEFKVSICSFEQRPLRSSTLFWPYLNQVKFGEYIEIHNFGKKTTCGEATLSMVKAKDICEYVINEAWKKPDEWFESNISSWFKKAKELE